VQTSISEIVKEALEIPCEGFVKLVERTTQLLSKEKGRVGNFNILGRLVKIEPSGEALIVGDLHGDLESLIQILHESDVLQKMNQASDLMLIFLGDYGDRGDYSAEVYYVVSKLKLQYPGQIVLMRGNHEGPKDLMPSPHDLPTQFQTRFGEKWGDAYARTRDLFEHLYNAVIVEGRYLMVHGGLPQQVKTVKDLAYAQTSRSNHDLLEEILWSDPIEIVEGVYPSPRGAGHLFGKSVTTEILRRFKVKIVIRGHEPCEEGFKFNHSGEVLTLFSRKGAPYFNVHGAYLDVNFSEKFQDAEQLIPYIHKF
jgi:protein phosphatase